MPNSFHTASANTGPSDAKIATDSKRFKQDIEANTAYAQSDLASRGSTVANSKIEWKAIAESIAMMAIVLSLVFVGLQLKQSQVIARNEIDGLFLENRIEAVGQINDHVNVWVRGLAAEKLSVDDAAVFENLLININDITFFTALNHFNLGSNEDARINIDDFAIFLHRNPGARRVWEARESRLAEGREVIQFGNTVDSTKFTFPYVEWVMQALENLDQTVE